MAEPPVGDAPGPELLVYAPQFALHPPQQLLRAGVDCADSTGTGCGEKDAGRAMLDEADVSYTVLQQKIMSAYLWCQRMYSLPRKSILKKRSADLKQSHSPRVKGIPGWSLNCQRLRDQ